MTKIKKHIQKDENIYNVVKSKKHIGESTLSSTDDNLIPKKKKKIENSDSENCKLLNNKVKKKKNKHLHPTSEIESTSKGGDLQTVKLEVTSPEIWLNKFAKSIRCSESENDSYESGKEIKKKKKSEHKDMNFTNPPFELQKNDNEPRKKKKKKMCLNENVMKNTIEEESSTLNLEITKSKTSKRKNSELNKSTKETEIEFRISENKNTDRLDQDNVEGKKKRKKQYSNGNDVETTSTEEETIVIKPESTTPVKPKRQHFELNTNIEEIHSRNRDDDSCERVKERKKKKKSLKEHEIETSSNTEEDSISIISEVISSKKSKKSTSESDTVENNNYEKTKDKKMKKKRNLNENDENISSKQEGATTIKSELISPTKPKKKTLKLDKSFEETQFPLRIEENSSRKNIYKKEKERKESWDKSLDEKEIKMSFEAEETKLIKLENISPIKTSKKNSELNDYSETSGFSSEDVEMNSKKRKKKNSLNENEIEISNGQIVSPDIKLPCKSTKKNKCTEVSGCSSEDTEIISKEREKSVERSRKKEIKKKKCQNEIETSKKQLVNDDIMSLTKSKKKYSELKESSKLNGLEKLKEKQTKSSNSEDINCDKDKKKRRKSSSEIEINKSLREEGISRKMLTSEKSQLNKSIEINSSLRKTNDNDTSYEKKKKRSGSENTIEETTVNKSDIDDLTSFIQCQLEELNEVLNSSDDEANKCENTSKTSNVIEVSKQFPKLDNKKITQTKLNDFFTEVSQNDKNQKLTQNDKSHIIKDKYLCNIIKNEKEKLSMEPNICDDEIDKIALTKAICTYRRRKSVMTRCLTEEGFLCDENYDVNNYVISGSQYELTEDEIAVLKNISITPFGPHAPLHTMATLLHNPPTQQQREEIKEMGIEIKSGYYTKEEDNIIKSNWERFCKEHDFDPKKPWLFFNLKSGNDGVMPRSESLEFVRCLAYGLERRLLNSIVKRFLILFDTKRKTGRFNESEDEVILKFMKRTSSNKPFVELSKMLNRPPLIIEKRFIRLTEQHDKIKWTMEMMEKFIINFLKVTRTDNVKDLNNAVKTDDHWQELSKLMNNIPNYKLKNAWNNTIQPRLCVEEDINWTNVNIKLIHLLDERKENDIRTINWKEIASHFGGINENVLNKKFLDMMGYYVPTFMKKNFSDCLNFLIHAVLPNYGHYRSSYKEKKLKFENGKLRLANQGLN